MWRLLGVTGLLGVTWCFPATAAGQSTDFGVLPIVMYDSDKGLGYGANIGVFFRDPELDPYRAAIRAQFFQTTRGIQKHFLRVDVPRVFGTRYRPYLSLM